MVDEAGVLKLVKSRSFRQMRTHEMAKRLSVKQPEMAGFLALLEDMERRGHLVQVKKDQWINPPRAGLITGRLQCNPRGFGFVTALSESREDVYVAEEDLGEAMDGDLVVAELRKHRPGGRRRKLGPSARVIKVIEHRNKEVIGTFNPGTRFGRVVPDNPRLFRDVYVAQQDWAGAEAGDKVLVALTDWPTLRRNPEGEIKEVLGQPGAPGVDVQAVILEFGLPREFPKAVVQAAKRLKGTPTQDEMAGRQDLRRYPAVTIDPEDAKDFDDALSFYRDGRTGRRVVRVHIADVSHHVAPDTSLDTEARKRGCSVYLANEVVPMLPHEESKNVLSLVQGEDRLAKTVTMQFDDSGDMVDYALSHSVVNISRRMSYTEVQEILNAADAEEPAAAGAGDEIVSLLTDLDALAAQLRTRRQEVGSVDLDMTEYHVDIDDDGLVVGVSQIVRDRSHGLVEEFMLSANRAVADFMLNKKLPALYRVHEPPTDEDLEEFAAFVRTVLNRRIDPMDRKQLQALLADVAGTHLSEAVNMQLLRSMQRALYQIKCVPHFALHFERYCHFTSPVRRYPDLIVHQILDQHLLEGQSPTALRRRWKSRLPNIATHCNQMQERADGAEREIVKIKLLRYLEQHRDQVFEAVITGVQEYGLFARLEDYSVEGLIKIKDLRDDFYRLDEASKALVGTRNKRRFQLGQTIHVVVTNIDMARRQLDLQLHE